MSDKKIALVTGSGSGIGRAVAELWGERGAHVIVSDVNEAGGVETVKAIKASGGNASFTRADVAADTDVKRLIEGAVADFGRLDWACNNAGILGAMLPTVDYPMEEFDKIIAINLRGVFSCMRHELAVMLRQNSGAIINICSETSIKGGVGNPAYTASKHAVHGLIKCAALEVARTGVRVNGVAPGNIRTGIVEAAPRELQAIGEQMMPAKRYGDPREIAEAVAWLASDAASLVNGHMLVADTGWAIS